MSKYLDLTGLSHFWDAFKARLLPSGGSSGQVLAKASGTDWDLAWVNQSGGGGSSPSPYGSNPEMDGTASAGTSDDYARGDHVHPHDTSKQDTLSVASGTLSKGSGASSLGTNSCRRYGKVVVVSVNGLTLASSLSSGSTSGTLATIPSGYRPHAAIRAPFGSSGNHVGYVNVTTGGAITLRNSGSGSIATSASLSFQLVFVIA